MFAVTKAVRRKREGRGYSSLVNEGAARVCRIGRRGYMKRTSLWAIRLMVVVKRIAVRARGRRIVLGS